MADITGTNAVGNTRNLLLGEGDPGAFLNLNQRTSQNVGQATPDLQGSQQFGLALMNLLRQYQQTSSQPNPYQTTQLNTQQEQANRILQPTPQDLIGASPNVQSSVRSAASEALNPTIASQGHLAQSFDRQLANFGNVLGIARQIGSDFESSQNRARDDARNLVNNAFTLFGGGAFNKAAPEELAKIEKVAQLPKGYLEGVSKTLKEREIELNKQRTYEFKEVNGNLYKVNTKTGDVALAMGGGGGIPKGNELLSVQEAESLGVPYGTTRAQGAALSKVPQSQEQRKKIQGLTAATNVLNDLQTSYAAIGFGDSVFGANARGLKAFAEVQSGADSPAAAYESARNFAAGNLVSAIVEAGARVNEAELQRAISRTLPRLGTTDAAAKLKFDTLKTLVKDVIAGHSPYNSGPSLEIPHGQSQEAELFNTANAKSNTVVMIGPKGKFNVPLEKVGLFKQNGYVQK